MPKHHPKTEVSYLDDLLKNFKIKNPSLFKHIVKTELYSFITITIALICISIFNSGQVFDMETINIVIAQVNAIIPIKIALSAKLLIDIFKYGVFTYIVKNDKILETEVKGRKFELIMSKVGILIYILILLALGYDNYFKNRDTIDYLKWKLTMGMRGDSSYETYCKKRNTDAPGSKIEQEDIDTVYTTLNQHFNDLSLIYKLSPNGKKLESIIEKLTPVPKSLTNLSNSRLTTTIVPYIDNVKAGMILTHSDKTSGESDADRELLTSIYKILGIIKVLQANSHPHSFGKCRHSKRRHSKRRHSKRRHSRR